MEDSIFTKIIKGDIPCHKVYEDDDTIAFLDINPVTEGHTLVVPKRQVEFVWDLEDNDYINLMNVVHKIGSHLRRNSGKKYVSQMVVGVDVPHSHIHLIPFNTTEELSRAFNPSSNDPDHATLARVADKLRLQ